MAYESRSQQPVRIDDEFHYVAYEAGAASSGDRRHTSKAPDTAFRILQRAEDAESASITPSSAVRDCCDRDLSFRC